MDLNPIGDPRSKDVIPQSADGDPGGSRRAGRRVAFDEFSHGVMEPSRFLAGDEITVSWLRSIANYRLGQAGASQGDRGSEIRPSEPKPFRETAESPKRGRRILVVEDDVDTAISLAKVLELWGHLPVVAHDGDSALREAMAAPPEVVLLDLGLPRMNGFEVARRLRETLGDRPKLVAITGINQGCADEAWELNFDSYLIKPAPPEVLQGLLERLADEPPRDPARRLPPSGESKDNI